MAIKGTAGNDDLTGTGDGDRFRLYQGGDDIAHGEGGNDRFQLRDAFTADDAIDGGSGSDQLVLKGDYPSLLFGATTMVGVESLKLKGAFDYNLVLDNANVAAGETLSVNARTIKPGHALVFDGTAETDGSFSILASEGNDVIGGGAQGDTFNLSGGGDDSANGGGGNDVFDLGGALTALDTIDGGSGDDTLSLAGGLSQTLAASTITGVETITLAGGNFSITTDDGNVALGQVLTIDASGLLYPFYVIFDGSAEIDGSFHFVGGPSHSTATGGAQADTFDLTGNAGYSFTIDGGGGDDQILAGATFGNPLVGAADSITGGSGTDEVVLNGDYASGVVFDATTLLSVEALALVSGNDYGITTHDATVTSGTFTMDGSALIAGDVLTFDGSAETDASFAIIGGTGDDVLTGGALADTFDLTHGGDDVVVGGGGTDTFTMGVEFGAADSIDGGTGTDTLSLNGDYAGVVFGAATLTNVELIALATAHDYSLTTDDTTVASGQTLTVNATALVAGDNFIFNGAAETDGSFTINAGSGGSTLKGGGGNDTFILSASGGNDSVTGGAGADFINRGSLMGAKTFVFNAVSDSTSTGYDHIQNLNLNVDRFDVAGTITGVDTQVEGGTASAATFDADVAAQVGAGQLAANHAVQFRVLSGDLAPKLFLIVDQNGVAGYQGGEDLIVWIQAVAGGPLSTANFI